MRVEDNEQEIRIIPHNPIYKGPYLTRVLTRGENSWIIAMPEDGKRFVPLPISTIIDIEFLQGSDRKFTTEVLDRNFRGLRTLTIAKPGAISRGKGEKQTGVRVIAFSSGKGGGGKSTVIINVALGLQLLGKKCCLIDADLGTADIDTLLNLEAPYNLNHILKGEKDIEDILVKGPEGVLLVPGGSGLQNLANLKEWQFSRLIAAFNNLNNMADFLLLDTGAGVSRNVTNFLMAADEIVLVASPEPHVIMDVYALIKVLAFFKIKSRLKLVVNKTEKPDEAHLIWTAINSASRQFLDVHVEFLGHIPSSKAVLRSIKKQEPFILKYPRHEAARNFLKIAELLAGEESLKKETQPASFLLRLKENIFRSFSLNEHLR